MRLYLDTEFTCLNPFTYQLISLALVAADGRELYFELLDGWTADECSQFTRDVVLPLLRMPDYGITTEQARHKVLRFLEDVGECEIISDALRWDWPLMVQLLGKQGLPDGVVCGSIPDGLVLDTTMIVDAPHHALEDARMLCRAVEPIWQSIQGHL